MNEIKKPQFETSKSVIDLQNKVMEVLKASNAQLVFNLQGLTPEQTAEYLKAVEQEVTLYGTFPVMVKGEIQHEMKINVLRDQRTDIYDHFRKFGFTLAQINSDLKFLTMAYLEMLSNQPYSMDGINKSDALNEYAQLKDSVKENNSQYSL